ncbi:hypothetical protein EW146_g7497 [Bondarzewia mesenterica]|uniref:C2 domain-containing protein n=1 Tax=Bondarzewia mesenterica TaxID=1095465 RepID=A0A4S4LKM9_9AGAM|nr:hypothetical protein EW146_g7497 [Bondarzewia mesenterica]
MHSSSKFSCLLRSRSVRDAYILQDGAPLYFTRFIKGGLNPIYEETAVLLVDGNVVKLKEQLKIQLWKCDRSSTVSWISLSSLEVPQPTGWISVSPPDEDWVGGIVGINVHEIRDLGIGRGGRLGDKDGWGVKDRIKEKISASNEGDKGSDEEGEEEGEELSSNLRGQWCG